MYPNKNVVISVGPIPARLDSVKFVTNRFKGGLALKTVQKLLDAQGIFVTVVAWKHTDIPYEIERRCANVFRVDDVTEYHRWFVDHAKDYSAFIMAAAVANLMPVEPFKGKFPSHLYKPGEEFDIKFTIAPRAIDAVKALNPRACLIGYKLFDAKDDAELIDIARITLDESKANLIFANTPAEAKTRKLALTQDGSVIPCTFDEHVDLIIRAIRQQYYRTVIEPLTEEEQADPDIREALATVESFENSFEKYGTVAVAVPGHPGMFATTSRGHKKDPVVVRRVDYGHRVVYASGKATLNAPAMDRALYDAMLEDPDHGLIVHRHVTCPTTERGVGIVACPMGGGSVSFLVRNDPEAYVFPGTVEEVDYVKDMLSMDGSIGIYEPYHGYLLSRPIGPVDWTKYYEQFPDRYFSVPYQIQAVLDKLDPSWKTLELGGNAESKAKFVYDPYVESKTAKNVCLEAILAADFDLGYALNAVNYLDFNTLKAIVDRCDAFVANTFYQAPEKSVRGAESAILDEPGGMVRHTLRLPDDSIVRHRFHAYEPASYTAMGLKIMRYGKNSALVYKGLKF